MFKLFTRISTFVLLFAAFGAQAQDIHFSQFYSAPLLLNPAMTGNIGESYRASLSYRNQWASIPAPYSTVAASIDGSFLGCQLGADHVGAGLAIVNDRSGDGLLNDFSLMASAAYHKGLDPDRRYVLSLGGQVGYVQKSIDIIKLLFETQINENLQFDGTLPNGEPFNSNKFNYIDLRAGGMFTGAINDRANVYVGGSFYHLTKPGESFLLEEEANAEKNVLDSRLVFHGGGSFYLGDHFNLSPSAIYMSQSGSRNIVVGTAFGYSFESRNRYSRGGRGRSKASSSSDGSAIYLGTWYRLNDAAIILLGIDYQSFKFGFSYDVNVSGLRQATLSQGAVELSMSYVGKMAECKRKVPTYCPRF
ncbi:MAG: PorP/SprF family type IX secretion system membrane protein [Sphingobacteriales bacterium]|jgi:type IX secretion system PorP/SprF family membrane protein|nr:PorP/SprF family type IX secretion system membrane protein [Sphingobacteriales bacterium]